MTNPQQTYPQQTNGANLPARQLGESRAVAIADALTRRQWDELTDIVVRRMERRASDELARRGRNVSKRSF